MKLAIGIILFSVVLEMVLLLRMVRLKKQEKTQYEKADRMLTECIAKNLDMEKMLAQMGQDYKKQHQLLFESLVHFHVLSYWTYLLLLEYILFIN